MVVGIKNQSFGVTVGEIKAIWNDEDFRIFFSLSNAKESVAE